MMNIQPNLINAGPVLVGLLQEFREGVGLPLPDDGARDGDRVVHGGRDEG